MQSRRLRCLVLMGRMLVLWYVSNPSGSSRALRVKFYELAINPYIKRIPLQANRLFPQYTAAAKQSTLDPTARAIAALLQVLKNEPKLQSLIGAPTLSASDKSQIVAELEKHTGGADKSGTVKNFLSTLAQNNRLGLLEGACEKFGELMSAGKGEIELRVVSAQVCSHFLAI